MTDQMGSLRRHQSLAIAPWWYERIVAAVASAVIGLGLVGMLLANLGWFRIGPVVGLGVAASYTVFERWFHSEAAFHRSVTGAGPARAVIAIAILSLAFNWTAAAETMLTDGEAGVMVNAARHLDETGSLTVEASVGPFAEARVGFVADGFVGRGVGGTLRSEVPHIVPVLRGIGGWFGRTPLLAVGALMGSAALLAFYWFAARIIHPWLAVILTASLSLSLPFLQAARGFYPELLAMFGVFAGLSLLWGLSESADPWRGGIAGVLLGSATLARPEWALVAIPFGVFVALAFVGSTSMSWLTGRSRRRLLLAATVGYVIPVVVAVWDAARSGSGLVSTFEPRRAGAAIALATVVFGILRLAGRVVGEQPRFAYADMQRAFAYLVAGVILVGSVVSFLRPQAVADEPSTAVVLAQQSEGVAIDGLRSYDEDTGRWILWYLGPVAAGFGVVGLALLITRVVDNDGRRTLLFLLITLFVSFAAIIDAGPDPVQIVASRRLLFMAIPGLLIGVGAVAQRLYDDSSHYVSPRTVIMVLALGATVAIPLFHAVGIAGLSDHRGAREGVTDLCSSLGRRTAVLFAETSLSDPGAVAVQTVRGFCGVPAARAVEPSLDEIAELSAAWGAEGFRLVVISDEPLAGLAGRERIDIEWESLETTVESRPNDAERGQLTLFLAGVE
ncbi:MAG: hypothetical protein OES13_04745 [Acidimicrobiia bacterium]|nr:hypothetical protein [Acidimicrobiia bacterium]